MRAKNRDFNIKENKIIKLAKIAYKGINPR